MYETLLTAQAEAPPIAQPLFDPTYINLGYIYNFLLTFLGDLLRWLLDLLLLVGPYDSEVLRNFLWLLALLFAVGITYLALKYRDIRREEKEIYEDIVEHTADHMVEKERNSRWQQVMDHIDSMNEADWRLAILEADNVLEEMLDSMGYQGVSIGEKLKSIEQSDFLTLPLAWEAHKVRNKIAHEGASFALSQREAERVIDLYREVFTEFHYI